MVVKCVAMAVAMEHSKSKSYSFYLFQILKTFFSVREHSIKSCDDI